MKMDTTSWIMLVVLALILFYEFQKKQQAAAATGSLSGGYLPGAAGAAGKAGAPGSSLLQQLLGGGGGSKPSAAITGGSAGQTTGSKPSPIKLPTWLLPKSNPVATISTPGTGLIPSIAPPVWQSPAIDVGDLGAIPTIPADTSSIFITPNEPPSYTNPTMSPDWATSSVIDTSSATWILDQQQADSTPDSTFFSPVDTQTIDTDTLGGIAYQTPETGGDPTLWYDGADYSGGTAGNTGGGAGTGYGDSPESDYSDG